MPVPDHRSRSAEEIVGADFIDDSAWHVWTCLSWHDHAERTNHPTALHYAGLHLRHGIERLWFEVLFVAQAGSVGSNDYQKAVKSATKLYKLIDVTSPNYRKYAEFVQVVATVDSRPHPPSVVWDFDRLKRIHGECGERFMHFPGVLAKGYRTDAWTGEQMRFLFDSASWIMTTMETRGNLVVYHPEGLQKPEVFGLWERFRDGLIDGEAVRLGLKIVQPILRSRGVG